MKFHFEPNLKFQKEAIKSVERLFDGAVYARAEDRVFEVSKNILHISKEKILENRDKIFKQNEIEKELAKKTDDLDFCIEMETGTGKTYVYLRTIFELYKKYGLNKFIIVVPSIAIREGVLKTLEITKEHFNNLYNTSAEVIEYDSKKLNKVRGFCFSNHLSIMVMNTQAFNSDDNIINLERDANNGEKLINLIKRTRPIIIMDEPQEGMDSENMVERFKALNPLFKLRYSATHRLVKNLIYRLTPYDSYNQGLVKKIEVLSIHETNTQSNIHLEFVDIKLFKDGKLPQAKLKVNFRLAGGDFKTKTALFKAGDDLETKTKNPVYKGWVVDRIRKDPFNDETSVVFSNGTELQKGKKHGFDKESIFREQIKRTIASHFNKKEKLKEKNIKALTLFFIDKVANYVGKGGIIKKIFQEEYEAIYKKKYGKEPDNTAEVQGSYFAQTGKGDYTDNENAMKKNKDIYDRILRQKELLLSFDDSIEFIFSHSALGVGWDNPNVFNICTLNESESTIKKRQEIGRGLRICVDQEGNRVRDPESTPEGEEINLLTVIANQSYYSFASTYQEELKEEYGEQVRQPKLRDANKDKNKVSLNKNKFESEDFKRLWEKINQKTTCAVHFRENEIIDKCVEALNGVVVQENLLNVELNKISGFEDEEIESENIGSTDARISGIYAKIDLVNEIAKETEISINTAKAIFEKLENRKNIAKNPMVFLSEATSRLKRIMQKEMVRVVKYEKLDDYYNLAEFQEVIKTYQDAIDVKNGVYDKVIYDSGIEKDFSLDLDEQNKVKVFLKLPEWYKIPTPIGKYNPDFALVIEKRDLDEDKETKYYFTVETKGSKEWKDLKEDEKLKIECAIRHFEAIGLVHYLYPVDDLASFEEKAFEVTGEKFFNK